MDNPIQLPLAPLTVTRHDTSLLHAEVKAVMLDGSINTGELLALSTDEIVTLRSADEPLLEIPFAGLRMLVFNQPLTTNPSPALTGKQADSGITPPTATQEFHVTFIDNMLIEGHARSILMNQLGLHIFRLDDDGETRRIFVPHNVVKTDLHQPAPASDEVIESGGPHAPGSHYPPGSGNATLSPHPIISRKRLGDLLLADKAITTMQLQDAIDAQQHGNRQRLGEILIEAGATTEQHIQQAIAKGLGIPFVNLNEFEIDLSVLPLISASMARRYNLLPVMIDEGRLMIAMSEPTNIEAIDMLTFSTGHNIEVSIATKGDIDNAIRKYYSEQADDFDIDDLDISHEEEEKSKDSDLDFERLGREKPIVKLANSVILDGIRRMASDIHIRPAKHHFDLLLRIDGTLVKERRFNINILPALISRIKIIGRMDITERRLPQDGRARVVLSGDEGVDLRISIMPTVYGESAVIRILNTSVGMRDIDQLGFNEHDEESFTHMLHKSNGILLVTGPTGSGKSTTLYAALGEIIKQNVNIITVEDPVEYQIEGIEQIQVNTVPGYTFARALRNILRHDPDVIMIGEIRDQETGKIAIESALTGHLVLSTLHTNDAASTVVRLMEMGVESYLISSSLLGVLAQRLVRKNCEHCLEVEHVAPGIRTALGVREDEAFFKGKGCDQCNNTGYSGRMAVYELLTVTPTIRHLITEDMTTEQLQSAALSEGMTPLTNDALAKARQRTTSLEEVYRVRLS